MIRIGCQDPLQVRTPQEGCTQQRSFQSPIDPFSGPYDHNSAKSGNPLSGFVHFSPCSSIWCHFRARKCPHSATMQQTIPGSNGLGHLRHPHTSQTRIRASFHRVIFAGSGYWGNARTEQRSAFRTLLNTVIILRRKIVKLWRNNVDILRNSVPGPEKQGKRGLK
jgi:hypothetical protein